MTAALEVVATGMMATIQDMGRSGQQAQGMPVSGALDPANLRLANALVGNAEDQGALELRILGPTLKVKADSVRIALTGTQTQIEILSPSECFVSANRSVTLQSGDVFRIGAIRDSAVCYLSVEGGFHVPSIYGSQSTYMAGGFGGLNGRSLKAGDRLPLVQHAVGTGPDRICPHPLHYEMDGPIRVVLGPQDDYFTKAGINAFLSGDYCFTAESNRMGVRLDGPVLEHSRDPQINSDGIVTGAIQVPGNGLPIILLADHQTTGGYPKIATVISADVARLGRLAPGAKIRFAAVTVSEAERARRGLEERILASLQSIDPLLGKGGVFDYWLAHTNLISGAVAE